MVDVKLELEDFQLVMGDVIPDMVECKLEMECGYEGLSTSHENNKEYAENVGGISSTFDSEQLIMEVKKRPALYNKQLKDYSDRNMRGKMWVEVCNIIVPNWTKLSAKDKKIKGAEVQRKWKSLKDCFQREIAGQRRATSEQGTKKRRKNIYFDDLLFMVPFVKGRYTKNFSQNGDDEDTSSSHTRNNTPSNVDEQTGRPLTSYEASILEILRAKQNGEVSEDKHFALMLVPMMGRLNEEQKHYAKIEILNIMRSAANYKPEPTQPAHSQTFQRDQPGADHVQYRQTQNPESGQHFNNGFAPNVLSPSSTSGSDLFDMSNNNQ